MSTWEMLLGTVLHQALDPRSCGESQGAPCSSILFPKTLFLTRWEPSGLSLSDGMYLRGIMGAELLVVFLQTNVGIVTGETR